jgi:hypothetical protein
MTRRKSRQASEKAMKTVLQAMAEVVNKHAPDMTLGEMQTVLSALVGHFGLHATDRGQELPFCADFVMRVLSFMRQVGSRDVDEGCVFSLTPTEEEAPADATIH